MDGKKKAKTVPARSWFGAWRRKRRAAQPDFADMGTAFGLELSLNQKLLDDMLPPAPTPAMGAG